MGHATSAMDNELHQMNLLIKEAYAERGLSQASSQVRRSRRGCFA